MRVVLTGAAGQIGRELVEEFSGVHDLCLLDCVPVPSYKSIIVDLAQAHSIPKVNPNSEDESLRWSDLFKGADAIIHLAEDPNPGASWDRVLYNNIQATWNVLQAAKEHQVGRVLYASSNFAVRALELELAPACYEPNGPKIRSDAPPRPVTPYGIGKACGEITGRMLVDEKKLSSFVAVRIGWYQPGPPKNEGYYRLELLPHDLRALFRRCVESDFKGYHVVYGISAQKTGPYDLRYTRELLSWEPGQIP